MPHIPDAELLARLDDCPEPLSVWRHYRGGLVCVTGRALDEATLAPLVLYCHVGAAPDLPTGPTFARPLAVWHSPVPVSGGSVPRFVRLAIE